MIRIATTQLWVHDQEVALDFYTKKLGMEVREDATLEELGWFRWLVVGPVNQPEVAITLMAIPPEPVMSSRGPEAAARADGQGLRRDGLPDDR